MRKKVNKKTKIVATISDIKCDFHFIKELYDSGMDVVRLNTAHQDHEAALKVIKNVRKVSDNIAILLDTKGPEIRTLSMELPVIVEKSGILKIFDKGQKIFEENSISVSYENFSREVDIRDSILIDDGEIELKVLSKHDGYLECMAVNKGIIKGKKSVNVPGSTFHLSSLTEKDRNFIEFAIEQDLDFIAHSFVRNKEDVLAVQEILDRKKSPIKILAKIENRDGVENLEEILDHVYGIMIARGDLAIEMPYEKIPGIQKRIIQQCIERRKVVIVATQMLHTMIHNPRPTRAEVTDIASAIYSQTDAIMLSGETAYGDYPVEAVMTMARIAREVEKSKEDFHDTPAVVLSSSISAYLSKSAVKASLRLNARAIVSDSYSGRTIRNLSAFRGRKPVYAMCYDKRLVRQLALSYGVLPQYMEKINSSTEFIKKSINSLLDKKLLRDDDLVVIVAGNFGQKHGASFMEISTAVNLKNY